MSGRKDRRGIGRGESPAENRGEDRGADRGEVRGTEQAGPDAPLNDLTGNGIVNNGPENELSGLGDTGADRCKKTAKSDSGGDGDGVGNSGVGGGGADGGVGVGGGGGVVDGGEAASNDLNGVLDGDELALRRMLHGAVGDLRPSDGALDHLRKAVPTRRARKRQAVVGMAAAALLFGTAVPAFVHVANSTDAVDDRAVSTGHGEQTQGGTDAGKGTTGGKKDDKDSPSDKVSADDEDEPGKKDKPDGGAVSGSPDGGKGGSHDPDAPYETASSPACDPSQLLVVGQTGAPDTAGTVYGSFRVSNVSASGCAVAGRGTVGTLATGAADRNKITVVQHTAGDPAAGLPDPSQEAAALVLPPDGAYEVKFAWVPSETCPTTGASPDPSPSEDGTAGTTGDPGTGPGTDPGGSNTETQLTTDGGTMDGSVAVSHTAAPGAPSGQTTISNACAGTIYKTGVLKAS
ncbi:hypothetical protein ACFRMN_22230 [Streptomyces sp. NPDC056835]|uniref:hypothetical protein n=1 Tax=Streptomyces sp. NPDC056835 TaxID=3345956 RepID=UPI0036C8D598